MSLKPLLIALLLSPLVSSATKSLEYVCTPDDAATQLTYTSKAFRVDVSDDCISLQSLEDKSRSWSWKVFIRDSLGNKEGSRHFCDKTDSGWLGNPAIWRQDDRKLITFNEKKPPNSFTCVEFNNRK